MTSLRGGRRDVIGGGDGRRTIVIGAIGVDGIVHFGLLFSAAATTDRPFEAAYEIYHNRRHGF